MLQARIVTMTLNPAVDRSGNVHELVPTEKMRCTDEHCHPGGGGINVARAFSRLGADAIAIFPTGGLTGALLKQLILEEDVEFGTVEIQGATRENINIGNLADGKQYRFVFPGAAMTSVEIDRCSDLALSHVTPGSYFVGSGSLPPGAPLDTYAALVKRAAAKGAQVALDSSGDALVKSLGPALSLFKLNEAELEDITGVPVHDRERCIAAARQLLATGARMAAITRGARGALLVTLSRAWEARAPEVKVVSTVGAGDTFLATLLWALSRQKKPEEALRHAVAAGSAALLAEGTGLARLRDIETLIHKVEIETIHVIAEPETVDSES
jgi:6-phosphofructokinase 2